MDPRGSGSPVLALIAGFLCTALSATGFFVAVWGERIEGGIWFLPDAANQALGRFIFGLGALMVAALAAYAFHDAWRLFTSASHKPSE